ncbi:MAG: sigma-70 family RNA polymerase sigma factor [Dehalococcoidia bacterium]
MQSEERIVRSAQAGDDRAFEQIYEEYFDKVYRYIAVRVGNQPDAEDLTEDVFVKALQSIGSFQWRGISIAAWLFRIAHNTVVDHLRRVSKRQTMPIEESVPCSGPTPHERATINLAMERLRHALSQLTQAQQQVLSMRLAGGLSIAETARVLGKTEGAVKASQHSALAAIRRIFSREFGDVPEV